MELLYRLREREKLYIGTIELYTYIKLSLYNIELLSYIEPIYRSL